VDVIENKNGKDHMQVFVKDLLLFPLS